VTGWNWETVDTTMTMSRLLAMNENLNVTPLIDTIATAYMGYEYTKPYQLEDEVKHWLASQGLSHGGL
jgi:hypothetical protein